MSSTPAGVRRPRSRRWRPGRGATRGEVRRGEAAAPRASGPGGERGERSPPAGDQRARPRRPSGRVVGPAGGERGRRRARPRPPRRPGAGSPAGRRRSGRAVDDRRPRGPGTSRRRRAPGAAVDPAEVVDQHLRAAGGGQHRAGLRMQVAEHAEAQAGVGHGPALLLDGLEHPAGARPAGEGVVEVDGPGVEPHRAHAGQPADGAGQVDGAAATASTAASSRPWPSTSTTSAVRPASPAGAPAPGHGQLRGRPARTSSTPARTAAAASPSAGPVAVGARRAVVTAPPAPSPWVAVARRRPAQQLGARGRGRPASASSSSRRAGSAAASATSRDQRRSDVGHRRRAGACRPRRPPARPRPGRA